MCFVIPSYGAFVSLSITMVSCPICHRNNNKERGACQCSWEYKLFYQEHPSMRFRQHRLANKCTIT